MIAIKKKKKKKIISTDKTLKKKKKKKMKKRREKSGFLYTKENYTTHFTEGHACTNLVHAPDGFI